jgi:hypothetical protein
MMKKTCILILAIIAGLLIFTSQNGWCLIENPYSIRIMLQHTQVGNITQSHHVAGHASWQQDLSQSDQNEEQQGSASTQTGKPVSGMSGSRVIFQERKTNPNNPK